MESITISNPDTGIETNLSLHPNFRIVEVAGLGLPSFEQQTRRGYNQRGKSYIRSLETERNITIRGFLDVSEMNSQPGYATLRYNLAKLYDLFSPTTNITNSSLLTLKIHTEDGRSYACDCYYVRGLESNVTVEARFVHPLSIELCAPSPHLYDPTARSIEFTGWGTGERWGYSGNVIYPLTYNPGVAIGEQCIINNPGTAPSQPIIEFDGPMVNPVIVHCDSGRGLYFVGTIPGEGKLTVDTRSGIRSWQMTGYGTTYYQYPNRTSESQFWDLQPGDNRIIMTCDAPHPNGSGRVIFHPMYKGV
jgi:hypothetical protein